MVAITRNASPPPTLPLVGGELLQGLKTPSQRFLVFAEIHGLEPTELLPLRGRPEVGDFPTRDDAVDAVIEPVDQGIADTFGPFCCRLVIPYSPQDGLHLF